MPEKPNWADFVGLILLFIATGVTVAMLFVVLTQLGKANEQLGVANEQLGMANEQLGVAIEQLEASHRLTAFTAALNAIESAIAECRVLPDGAEVETAAGETLQAGDRNPTFGSNEITTVRQAKADMISAIRDSNWDEANKSYDRAREALCPHASPLTEMVLDLDFFNNLGPEG